MARPSPGYPPIIEGRGEQVTEHRTYFPDGGPIEVILQGGPDDLPRAHRTGRASLTAGKLKIQHRNGYEHFELVDSDLGGDVAGEGDGDLVVPAVFRWIMRTKIAE
jgi:hypothetical protein